MGKNDSHDEQQKEIKYLFNRSSIAYSVKNNIQNHEKQPAADLT